VARQLTFLLAAIALMMFIVRTGRKFRFATKTLAYAGMGSLLHNLPIFQIFQKLRIDRSKKRKMNEENNLFLNFFKENEEKGRFRAKRRRFIRKFRDK
jgi:hypothetical protein